MNKYDLISPRKNNIQTLNSSGWWVLLFTGGREGASRIWHETEILLLIFIVTFYDLIYTFSLEYIFFIFFI